MGAKALFVESVLKGNSTEASDVSSGEKINAVDFFTWSEKQQKDALQKMADAFTANKSNAVENKTGLALSAADLTAFLGSEDGSRYYQENLDGKTEIAVAYLESSVEELPIDAQTGRFKPVPFRAQDLGELFKLPNFTRKFDPIIKSGAFAVITDKPEIVAEALLKLPPDPKSLSPAIRFFLWRFNFNKNIVDLDSLNKLAALLDKFGLFEKFQQSA